MAEIIVIQPTKQLENKIIRTAAYCRVSSDSEDQINSFLSQVQYYTALINEQPNTELVDIYAEAYILLRTFYAVAA